MYANLVIAKQQAFVSSDSLQIFGAMIAARVAMDIGEGVRAIHILKPYLDSGNPEAEYLYASCPGDNEEEVEKRHLEYIQRSASKEYPPALYLLGAYYDNGDYVGVDKQKAATLFARGAALGHLRCQWIHGEDLLYGRNGVIKNEIEGLALIRKAADAKLAQAIETMASFYQTGLYGISRSSAIASTLRNQMSDNDVVER